MSLPARMNNLILIGGSSRNVGKTTLALELIRKVALSASVTGLKVTSIRPGEEQKHGSHRFPAGNNYRITRETDTGKAKDTSAMLRAGAHRVFYIESPDNLIPAAMEEFMQTCYTGGPVVCESRSLRKAIIPGLFVLLKHDNPEWIKPGFEYYEALADIVFTINPAADSIALLSEKITWGRDGWRLDREPERNREVDLSSTPPQPRD